MKSTPLFSRIPVLTTVCASLLLGLTGCGPKGDGGSSSNGGTAPASTMPLPEKPLIATCEPGIPGGRLVIATFGDPKTFNPITANENSSQDIIRFLFSGLVGQDMPTQEITPALAESWSVAPDQVTWTFHLRKGVHWSDGHPLTADDVLYTWEVIYNPDIDNVTVDLFRIDGKNFKVTKTDDYTVQVVTPKPYAPFLEFFGGVPIIPKHILSKIPAKSFTSAFGINTKPEDIVVNGPYKLKAFKPGESVLLERNPWFWEVDKKGQRLPYLDNVIYTVVPDMNAMSLRFLSGEADAQEIVQPGEYDRFKSESAKGRFKLLELGLGLERYFLWFNLNTNSNPKTGQPYVTPYKLKWFRNQKFRQAISYALDRESIAKSIYAGRAAPNYGFTGLENKKWYNPKIPTYPLNQQKALTLLAEIGIKDRTADGFLKDADGNVIEIVLNTNTGNNARDKTAVLIAEDFKRLGIKIIYQPIEFNTLVGKIDNTYDYECMLLGLAGGGVDPASSMNVLLSNGFTHEWFPRQKTPSTDWEARIDQLMNEQIQTLDPVKRKQLFDEVQYILSDQVPMIYTVTPNVYSAIRSDIGNVRPSVLSVYRTTWNVEELYFKKQ